MNSLKHGLGKLSFQIKKNQEKFSQYKNASLHDENAKKNSVTFCKAERCYGISISNLTDDLFQDKKLRYKLNPSLEKQT